MLSRTSVKDIFAAGDAPRATTLHRGQEALLFFQTHICRANVRESIWRAALNAMKSDSDECDWFFGLHIITAGNYDGETYVEQTEEAYKNWSQKTAY